MSVCVSFVCVSVCPCVCVHEHSKNNGSVHLKLEHVVVFENSSDQDELDIWHCPIKVKSQCDFEIFLHLPQSNCQVLYLSFGTC